MISIESEDKVLEEWAVSEIKEVGRRGFEFSKFFFGISAGSFAIFPFFEAEISLVNVSQIIGLLALAYSGVIAIKMADPADFIITDDGEISKEHEKYASRVKTLRGDWIKVWLAGIFFVFLGMTFEFTFMDLWNLICD